GERQGVANELGIVVRGVGRAALGERVPQPVDREPLDRAAGERQHGQTTRGDERAEPAGQVAAHGLPGEKMAVPCCRIRSSRMTPVMATSISDWRLTPSGSLSRGAGPSVYAIGPFRVNPGRPPRSDAPP